MKLSHFALAAGLMLSASLACAQAGPTATRFADLQAGGGFTWANSDYVPNKIAGFSIYADLDLHSRYGLEFDFHQVKDPNDDALVPSNHFSERTYEFGGRYVRHYYRGRLSPYGKLMYGRGVANFPAHLLVTPTITEAYIDNIAYNLVSFGAGADYSLTRRVNLRADFEYQHWFANDRELPDGLGPYMLTFGAAYHFPAKGPFKLKW